MKKLKTLLYIFTLILFTSCGEDRSYEYFNLIKDDSWIEETMKQHYLWYNEMQETKRNDFFAIPEDFLNKIVFKGSQDERADIFSRIEYKEGVKSRSYLQRTSTYGFDFQLYEDPTRTTTHKFARVLFVLPNSPAKEAGLERGDWISQVNGYNLNSDNYGFLVNGGNTSFTLVTLNNENETLSWSAGKNINVTASRAVEINPFYVDTTYTIQGKNISYLVYNEFSTGPNNEGDDTQYLEEMKQIFARFKSKSTNDFILDLRYNPGGYLSQVLNLGSMTAPLSALGKVFYTLQYNDKTSPNEVSGNLNNNLAPYNLNLSKIYILTSSVTASASEDIINCLKPYFGEENVIQIGETTFGKNVCTSPYTTDELDFTLWPVVAYVKNANNFYKFSKGIQPTFTLSESNMLNRLLPLGNTNEFLLKNTLSYILTGTMPDLPKETDKTTTSILYNSINSKYINGAIIK